jgi:hypothetical protein
MARSVWLAIAVAGCRLHSAEVDALDAATPAADADVPPDAAAAASFRAGNSVVIAVNGEALGAHFWAGSTGPGSCLYEPVAGCELRTCEATPDGTWPSAGRIAFTSTLDESALVPAADGHYAPAHDEATLSWNPGDAIRISAEGGAVPAFDQDLTGPASIESLVAPEPSAEGVAVRRDEPLAVAWTGADQNATASVSCEPDGTTRVQVHCELTDGSQTGSIPAAALSRLPASCPAASLVLSTEERAYVDPGGGFLVKIAVRGPSFATDLALE